MRLSQASAQQAANPGVFQALCERVAAEEVPNDIKSVIDKDMPRTFPGHAAFPDSGQREPTATSSALTKSLYCFALHCPDIEYVQGMGLIGGLLMLAVTGPGGVVEVPIMRNAEEECFWLLDGLIRNMLPPSFLITGDPSLGLKPLQGLQIVMEVLSKLLAELQPELHQHLEHAGVDSALVWFRWLPCLFANSLRPMESCMRVWDLIMAGGMLAVHQCALALTIHVKDKLLEAKEPHEIGQIIDKIWVDPETLIGLMHGSDMVTAARVEEMTKQVVASQRAREQMWYKQAGHVRKILDACQNGRLNNRTKAQARIYMETQRGTVIEKELGPDATVDEVIDDIRKELLADKHLDDKPRNIIAEVPVLPSTTLQSLALAFDCRIADITRANNMSSRGAILSSTILVPVSSRDLGQIRFVTEAERLEQSISKMMTVVHEAGYKQDVPREEYLFYLQWHEGDVAAAVEECMGNLQWELDQQTAISARKERRELQHSAADGVLEALTEALQDPDCAPEDMRQSADAAEAMAGKFRRQGLLVETDSVMQLVEKVREAATAREEGWDLLSPEGAHEPKPRMWDTLKQWWR